MAGNRGELERLRQEARQASRRAGNKLSRLRREQGVKHTGGIDPRVPSDRIGRMNRIQLRSYINRVSEFTNRRVQFVADAKGNPIDRRAYDWYKWVENRVNMQREKFLKSVQHYKLPEGDMTVGDWVSLYGHGEQKPHMVTNSLTRPLHRKPQNFTSQSNVEKLTKVLQNEWGQQGKRIGRWKDEAGEMLKDVGGGLLEKFNKLSDRQVAILWSGSGFANSASTLYFLMKSKMSYGGMEQSERSILGDLIDWAGEL